MFSLLVAASESTSLFRWDDCKVTGFIVSSHAFFIDGERFGGFKMGSA
jgi:hypothetical protein